MSSKQPALGFIFVTLLIDIIGWGVIIPVMPNLMMELTGKPNSEASIYGMITLVAYAIMQFFCAPIAGGLSDKYGRRPILLASLFGFCLDYIAMAIAPNVIWLIITRVIAGALGASFTTASAYIADISTPEKRAQNFGIIGVAFGLGFIIGPVIGGLLAPYGLRVPFMACAVLTFVNGLYGYFILPESLAKENRREFDWKRANPWGSLMQLRKYPVLTGLVTSLMLLYIASHAVQSNWGYYTFEKFQWDPKMIGWSLMLVGFVFAIVQGGLIRVVIPKLGQAKSVYVGLGFYGAGFILYALATQSWMMFAFTIVYCLGGIAGPALQGIISSQVPPNEQGELQGALTSLMSVTSIIGPALMMGTFSVFTKPDTSYYLPGAPMLLGAVMMIVSTYLARKSLKKNHIEAAPASVSSMSH
jgi:DHA1 family tetracycline resistance protein-like MFS transporter